MIRTFDELMASLKGSATKTIAVAFAHDTDVLGALGQAQSQGIANAILVGPHGRILEAAASVGVSLDAFEIVDVDDEKESAVRSVQLVREGKADVLMKGLCGTSTILKAVLDKEKGLRTGSVLSHIAVFEAPCYHKLFTLSDAAMNIAPDLNTKVDILNNAVKAVRRLGIETPKAAMVCAVEKVNSDMPATLEAAIITAMANRGQIKNVIVDGPLAVDNAFSAKSCEVKGIKSPVGGDADIAVVPDIEAGNCFYKAMTCLAGARVGGVIVGALKPIVLTSRADSDESKLSSIALAMKVS